MMRYAVLSLFALIGCASHEELRQNAMMAPDSEVCYWAAAGNSGVRSAAYEAISARRVDCAPHQAMVIARIQADQARSSAIGATGLMLMQAGRAQPAPIPRATYCRTVPVGSGYNTVCD